MDERDRRRAERLEAELAAHGPLEPPWARYPWIKSGSIGWRMGDGEHYAMLWGRFCRTHLAGVDTLIAHLQQHPRAPRSWRRSLRWMLAAAGGGPDDDAHAAALDAQIDAAGLLGDDVAYAVHIRNLERAGGVTAPWTWRSCATPEDALRYSAREVGWWARWLATACPDRAAWRAQAPAAPAAWAEIEAVLAGAPPAPIWTGLDHGAGALIAAMLPHGPLPPPWLGGHPPLDEIHWSPPHDDRDRWAWWVVHTFDDAASWAGYLAPWPPPPPWRAALDDALIGDRFDR
jgi:hypothetical protein